jgi:hypothetical protein
MCPLLSRGTRYVRTGPSHFTDVNKARSRAQTHSLSCLDVEALGLGMKVGALVSISMGPVGTSKPPTSGMDGNGGN